MAESLEDGEKVVRHMMSDAVLDGRIDWALWLDEVTSTARALQVWEYVDPEGTSTLVEPTKPTPPRRPSLSPLPTRQQYESDRDLDVRLEEAKSQRTVTLRNYDLACETYRADVTEYMHDMHVYSAAVTDLRNLNRAIYSRLSSVYCSYLVYKRATTVRSMIQGLREMIVPADNDQEERWAIEDICTSLNTSGLSTMLDEVRLATVRLRRIGSSKFDEKRSARVFIDWVGGTLGESDAFPAVWRAKLRQGAEPTLLEVLEAFRTYQVRRDESLSEELPNRRLVKASELMVDPAALPTHKNIQAAESRTNGSSNPATVRPVNVNGTGGSRKKGSNGIEIVDPSTRQQLSQLVVNGTNDKKQPQNVQGKQPGLEARSPKPVNSAIDEEDKEYSQLDANAAEFTFMTLRPNAFTSKPPTPPADSTKSAPGSVKILSSRTPTPSGKKGGVNGQSHKAAKEKGKPDVKTECVGETQPPLNQDQQSECEVQELQQTQQATTDEAQHNDRQQKTKQHQAYQPLEKQDEQNKPKPSEQPAPSRAGYLAKRKCPGCTTQHVIRADAWWETCFVYYELTGKGQVPGAFKVFPSSLDLVFARLEQFPDEGRQAAIWQPTKSGSSAGKWRDLAASPAKVSSPLVKTDGEVW